ncbi:DNA internalization-related competence protein ComEC/Rec2 [Massilia glaciei]|uniref:DNA internalization-related competence protein ComEC/Rec2 n=1 Tax=Massilia glaciei TaxID=1524097 RepID=A0A2U2HGV7_9BURK|nr:DNA internalization-related competence protein ComEC/Rec2 [Massilia glaciei]PWF44683.1 DNA internalization-related competence protein ComEC/Rec2 [Massilia glaciei]
MRCAILGFVAGAAVLQNAAALPSGTTLAALVALAVLLCLLRRSLCALAAGALLGFSWAALLAHLALAPQLARADEGRDITIVGTIDSLPHHFGQGVRFHFAVERVLGARIALPPRVALAWYSGYHRAVWQVGDVRPGERWQLTVRLNRPHGNANPHGFDYEVWLLERGLRATGYVRAEARSNRRLDGFVFSAGNLVERARAALRERILRALQGKRYAGVIVALVVGDQRAIEQSDWEVFNRTGVGHLISISGLHITMVAGLFAWLASALWRRSFFTQAQLPLLLPAQKVAALAGAGIAFLYVLLAGFGVPAQRTFYMLAVVALALWCGRITNVSHVLCAALGAVVLLDPWAVLQPGFWLSFGAVAVILYATTGRIAVGDGALREALRLGVRTQYVVTLGLVPLTMLLFAQVSLASPLANALAIPLISFVVTPLALVGSMLPAPLSTMLLWLAHLVVEALAFVLAGISASDVAVWHAPLPSAPVFCFALLGTVWMLAPRGWPHRWLGVVSWLPLLAGQPSHPAAGSMTVTAFDVGQGTALLIETSGHRLLYDTGPAYSPESNGGNRVIVPYLKARGISRLDGMVVTHSDVDHSGGALAIMQTIKVGWVASSLWFEHPIVRTAALHRRCSAGQSWNWDGVRFEMLHPTIASYDDPGLKPNARGCTLRITARAHSLLLAADIEALQEAQLVAGAAGSLRANVLLAPHHGSGTSSTPAFLAAVHPELALFQVGYRNRYKHPKAQVYALYGARGIRRLRSDQSGAISLQFGPALSAQEYRVVHARYWYGR